MRLSYDAEADAAYLQLVAEIGPGEASRGVGFIDSPNGEAQFYLDFDAAGRLLGIEVLFASKTLPAELLAAAEPEGPPAIR